jgi:hypothetical protein
MAGALAAGWLMAGLAAGCGFAVWAGAGAVVSGVPTWEIAACPGPPSTASAATGAAGGAVCGGGASGPPVERGTTTPASALGGVADEAGCAGALA